MNERDLYLDLLIDVLLNKIYQEPPCADPKQYWPSLAHTMVGDERLNNLRELAQRTLDDNIPGDYIETGVWRGGCCILMRGVLAANGEESRKVFVADSFEGFPRPDVEKFPADIWYRGHDFPEVAIPLEQVRTNFAKYGLLDERVIFVKGFFKDTLPVLAPTPLALIRLDGDMYESTIQALDVLYPRLSSGGFIIIDDYGLKSCKQAVEDFRTKHAIGEPLQQIDWTGIWWQKQTAATSERRDAA